MLTLDSNLLNRRMASVSPQNGSGDNQGASSLEVKEKPKPTALSTQEMDADVKYFNILFGVTQGIGILAVILVAIWTSHFRGGFAGRSEPSLEFNWHPLFMTIGFIYLFGSSIMIYRALRTMRKQKLKIIHASIHSIVVICIIIAQVTVFDSHNFASPPIPNLYTLHSWIGLTAIIIFLLQWLSGLVIFLYPGGSLALRAMCMPWHVFFGLGAFVLATAAALSGLLEKAIFSVRNYGELPAEGVLINVIGLCFICFAFMVVYLVTEQKYKRHPRPEDGALLQSSPTE
ncbi:plasma membrane ascorbate-dependent reductase CYBRD1 isoform X3 [Rhodnius prolixus]|uniref:plasma membrane ascorbate-dependent reductase CYBRD1 isoform X3 n=1 Tax=Rhodnius prolixus TaxID=13249 RepID=UPI003D18C3EB